MGNFRTCGTWEKIRTKRWNYKNKQQYHPLFTDRDELVPHNTNTAIEAQTVAEGKRLSVPNVRTPRSSITRKCARITLRKKQRFLAATDRRSSVVWIGCLNINVRETCCGKMATKQHVEEDEARPLRDCTKTEWLSDRWLACARLGQV